MFKTTAVNSLGDSLGYVSILGQIELIVEESAGVATFKSPVFGEVLVTAGENAFGYGFGDIWVFGKIEVFVEEQVDEGNVATGIILDKVFKVEFARIGGGTGARCGVGKRR